MRLIHCMAYGLAYLVAASSHAQSGQPAQPTKPCRVAGFRTEVQCGVVQRPLNPSNPSAGTIDVHYVVVPAVARNKKPDGVFFFAGGPGQSAIKIAAQAMPWFRRLNNWRDIVFIDQRGTGKSAPLTCKPEPRGEPLSKVLEMSTSPERMLECKRALEATAQGKALDQFSTTIAMQDADTVRAALGMDKINVVGVSYGTRAVLEYARAFPARVRRAVLDGVAPPDMVLPNTFAPDADAALAGLLAGCESDAACKVAYPSVRADLKKLLAQPGLRGTAVNPMTGREETITMSRDALAGLLRGPLYVPTLAATIPFAVTEAAAGRLTPIVGMGSALGGGLSEMAWGMHFSVVCSEDAPRMAASTETKSAVFGEAFASMYTRVCNEWPRAQVPAAFYTIPTAQFPALLMSGGADPATPPRHAERVAKALGPNAKHVVVAQAGHGVLGIGCMRDEMVKFVNAATDAEALAGEANCAVGIPRPTAWVLPGAGK